MTIVIDVGCARHGNDYSIERLVTEHAPRLLIGFDPLADACISDIEATLVIVLPVAAWEGDGRVGFRREALRSSIDPSSDECVDAIDLARVVHGLRAAFPEESLVLKIDAEGSEYVLLEHLIARRADEELSVAIVEWHPQEGAERRRARIEERLRCPIEEWAW